MELHGNLQSKCWKVFSSVALLLLLLAKDGSSGVIKSRQLQGSSGGISFSIGGRRNATGHWIITVKTRLGHPGNSPEERLWRLNVTARAPSRSNDKAKTEMPPELEADFIVSPPVARSGYEVYPKLGSRYKLHTTPASWQVAKNICQEEGAYLVVINGNEEACTLKKMFARHPSIPGSTWSDMAWIGFHDRNVEGTYLTVLDTPLEETGYTKWHVGKPDNYDHNFPPDVDSDCGAVHRSGTLHDRPCSALYAFFCEQQLS